MAEPVGEVWVPLVLGMQSRPKYDAIFKIGDEVKVLMSGKAYINRHTIDILPPCIVPYLKRDGDTRFSTVSGYVKDLSPYPSVKGPIGRIVLNFNEVNDYVYLQAYGLRTALHTEPFYWLMAFVWSIFCH